MKELIKQKFNYGTNSETPSLWASMGYVYGKCARQLHYINKYGYSGFTESEMNMMETGKDTHDIVEKWFIESYPDWDIHSEIKRSINITISTPSSNPNSPFRHVLPFVIGAKADLVAYVHPSSRHIHDRKLIEIKYLYGRSAYYQTLIERLLFPECDVLCFQYGNLNKPQFNKQLLITLKADMNMAIVYAGRMITSLYHLPPRFPDAHFSHAKCRGCMYREQCYSDTLDNKQEDMTWLDFKSLSQTYIDSVRKSVTY